MPFRPGQSGNPKGREPGTKNKKTLALEANPIKAKTTKDKNGRKVVKALALLSSIAANTDVNLALRISASTAILPYQESRKTHRYIERPFELPVPTNVEEAKLNIGRLASLAAAKKISLDEADTLASLQSRYIEATTGTTVEIELAQIVRAFRDQPPRAREIEVQGGLGVMPGHEDVIMPARTFSVTDRHENDDEATS